MLDSGSRWIQDPKVDTGSGVDTGSRDGCRIRCNEILVLNTDEKDASNDKTSKEKSKEM